MELERKPTVEHQPALDHQPAPILLEPEPKPERFDYRRVLPLYLLIAPALLLLAGWFYLPILHSLRMAFFRWDGLLNATFVGLDNFLELFQDKYFWISLGNMTLVLLFQFTFPFVMPFLTAKLITRLENRKVRRFYRTFFMIPYMIPPVAGYLLYRYIYEYTGVLNLILIKLQCGFLVHNWLNDPSWALLAILLVGFPFTGGSSLLIFSAGLESVPREMYDTVVMDGGNWWRIIRDVDIPFLIHPIRLIIVMTIGGIISNYVAVLLLTQGGPLFRTLVPGYYLFDKAFGGQRYGFACAVGLVLMAIVVVITIFTHYFMSSDATYYE